MKHAYVRRTLVASMAVLSITAGTASAQSSGWAPNDGFYSTEGRPVCPSMLTDRLRASCLVDLPNAHFDSASPEPWSMFDAAGVGGGAQIVPRPDGQGRAALLATAGAGIAQSVPLPHDPSRLNGLWTSYVLSLNVLPGGAAAASVRVRMRLLDGEGQHLSTIFDDSEWIGPEGRRLTAATDRVDTPTEGSVVVEIIRGDDGASGTPMLVDDVALMIPVQ